MSDQIKLTNPASDWTGGTWIDRAMWSITFLRVHGFLSDVEAEKARKRVIKESERHRRRNA